VRKKKYVLYSTEVLILIIYFIRERSCYSFGRDLFLFVSSEYEELKKEETKWKVENKNLVVGERE
jgi:hypothetical protein